MRRVHKCETNKAIFPPTANHLHTKQGQQKAHTDALQEPIMSAFSVTAPRFDRRDLAAEFNELSPSQKKAAQRDLYGLTKAIKENATMQHAALQGLSLALDEIQDKHAFLQALEQCPQHAQNDQFTLSFLRADAFDAKRASSRLVQYWEEKLKLFGPLKTFRPLTINDLEPQDLATLRDGGLRILPGKDSAGRGLLYCDATKWSRDRDSMIRILWYVVHSNLYDEEIQKNGLVMVTISHVQFNLQHFDRKLNNRMMDHCRMILPFKICGVHLLIKSHVIELALPFLLHAMGKNLRARFRIHEAAAAKQCMADLKEYGISSQQLPIEIGGTLDRNSQQQWIHNRLLQEGHSSVGIPTRSRSPPRPDAMQCHLSRAA